MKKIYEKPMIEIETYVLSASIAANCKNTVNLGPGVEGIHEVCSAYDGAFDVFSKNPNARSTGGTPFYSDYTAGCDCYYTSGGNGYFTS